MGVLSATEPQAQPASTAEPGEPALTRTWPLPPPEGFTADDLDRIPDLPPHTELIDGSLVLVSPQKLFHTRIISLLERQLWEQAPAEYFISREMSVTITERQRLEPDISVSEGAPDGGDEATSLSVESLVVAVEVVSPESQVRDRERKPQIYAKAGVRHFWRVENEKGEPVIYVYELDDVTGTYVPTGIHREHLKLRVPFDMDIDLLERRPKR
ncbi:Uma2 family endonuclease [Streptomonospora sp. S1-112]|uniref:Uma2 family endonuclease n=1 Tax=Streptomonospora mangrovi TaxID=2883123 RepID=A0A9X3NJS3_9ACTN|nr:Uma2 family endonuclease [Streptomonospora mangrovi]MDA0564295.1 Uma2 family endonuclease [Streptomonospora mangrovi]